MKSNFFLKTVDEFSGLRKDRVSIITILFVFLCAFSILQGESLDETAMGLATLSFDESISEEIVALDESPLIQQPVRLEQILIPAPTFELRTYKNSFLAVGLSAVMPGLGHFYLSDVKTAGAFMGITAIGVGGISLMHYQQAKRVSALSLQNAWSYGLYAVYRDARLYNRQVGYSYKMPTDSLSDLTSAPFSLNILKKPEVWGGFLAKFALAFGVAYFTLPKEAHGHSSYSLKKGLQPLIAFPVGVGEEALFRGYLQSQLSEISNPWAGIALSSLAFGVAHIPNALNLPREERRSYYSFSIPLITLGGAYYGWLTHKNHSLKESVAIHTWYDFVLLALGSFAGETALTGCPKIFLGSPF